MAASELATGSARTEQGALLLPPQPLDSTGGLHLTCYEQLWQWSVDSPALFWESVWRHLGVLASKEWTTASWGPGYGLVQPGSSSTTTTPPGQNNAPAPPAPPAPPSLWPAPLWFSGAKLNFSENLLRYCAPSPSPSPSPSSSNRDRTALISASEGRPGPEGDDRYTRAELWAAVASVVQFLRSKGIQPGDRIASYASNIGQNLIAFLGAAAVGAIWVSAAGDLAPDAVLDRLATVRPRILFTVNATAYGGKIHDHLSKVDDVVSRLTALPAPTPASTTTTITASTDPLDDTPPGLTCSATDTLDTVVIIQDLPQAGPSLDHAVRERDGKDGVHYLGWQEVRSRYPATPTTPIDFVQLDFNHPLWILFSSGTTGVPKAIVHRAGGMLLQLAKEHMVHGDVQEDDVMHYYSSTGWMMWNYAVGSLFTGCTLVLYEGAPLSPPRVLWDLSDRLGITIFGTSAAYLSALASSGFVPNQSLPTLQVKQVLSTGSPLRADLYPWIHDNVGPVLIGSITGGTDICSLFGAHCTALPVYAGEVQCRGLGMHVDVVDGSGNSVPPNQEGDLVCRTVFPVQPLGFWNQALRRYFDSYYAVTPGSWHHGDYVLLTEHGGLVMRGRSDGVLNPGGIRFGSSDLYDVLDNAASTASASDDVSVRLITAINDALAVGLLTPAKDDEVVVLFLDVNPVLISDEVTWESLVTQVKWLIRTHRSPRHVPRFVERVSSGGICKTLNGKKVEVPIKKILAGQSTKIVNPATLQNPHALEQYAILGQKLRNELLEQNALLAERLAKMNQ